MTRSRKPREKPDVGRLLNQLAEQEDEFLRREFLAPALPGGTVRVRIGGVVCKIRIEPRDFAGWGVFSPLSHTEAVLARPATMAERRDYLRLFPMIRLILCRRAGNLWYGSAASFGDARVRIEGLAPVHLAEEVQLFDCVCTRYDGSRFWFEEQDMRHDPAAASYLRSALHDRTEPGDLQRPGLTAEERAAYELNYWQLVRPIGAEGGGGANPRGRRRQGDDPPQSDVVGQRLRESLSHAGARLVEYLERADSFRVTFSVGDRSFTSSVNKDDLTVQVAGICLSGEDQKFDLGSLVGVLREGGEMGTILPIGDENVGMDEADYWRVHPPRN